MITKPKKDAWAACAASIIHNLEKRNMEGYYFENSHACLEKLTSLLPAGATVSWGGSETLKECGLMQTLQQGNYTLIDRSMAQTPEESRLLYSKAVLSQYFFMSSNAITAKGELVNIDGSGNRVACLISGPEQVIVIVGMNKITTDIPSAITRIRNVAAPINVQRLDKETPCHATGLCEDCFSPQCICNQLVITRRSGQKGRIKVFLIGEELGY
ncbi:MAG: lactate utilization protein [Lachnospiraceae bacterium]